MQYIIRNVISRDSKGKLFPFWIFSRVLPLKLYVLLLIKNLSVIILNTYYVFHIIRAFFLTSICMMLPFPDHTLAGVAFLFLRHGKLTHKCHLLGTRFRIYVELAPIHFWTELKSPSRSLLWPSLSPVTPHHITMFIFMFLDALSPSEVFWLICVYYLFLTTLTV